MIELRGASRTYVTDHRAVVTETDALVDVDLTVPPRQFVSIVGSSGSGKTTLLRIVAGLDRLTSGEVRVDGRPVTGPGPDRAVVFQDAALYPWRTVRANVRLGLELSGLARGEEAEEHRRPTARARRARAVRGPIPGAAVRRHAAACRPRESARRVASNIPDGRAVRRAGRDQPRADGRRAASGMGRRPADRPLRHPLPRRSSPPLRPGRRHARRTAWWRTRPSTSVALGIPTRLRFSSCGSS